MTGILPTFSWSLKCHEEIRMLTRLGWDVVRYLATPPEPNSSLDFVSPPPYLSWMHAPSISIYGASKWTILNCTRTHGSV